MHESTGQFPEGLFTDRKTNAIRSYGLFDECIDTRGPNTTDGSALFNGKYCTIFFFIEQVEPDELDNRTVIRNEEPEERGNWIT